MEIIVHVCYVYICTFLTNFKTLSLHILHHSVQCTTNDECSLTEACVGNVCQRPCDVKNTCTANAVCINTNHGTDCSCIDGYHGNGFVQCVPGRIYYSSQSNGYALLHWTTDTY